MRPGVIVQFEPAVGDDLCEPPRVCRRLFDISYAAISEVSDNVQNLSQICR